MNQALIISLIVGAVALASFALTGLVLRRAPLDHPSERSSHAVPTPRGGGMAIVFASCIALLWSARAGWSDQPLALALATGGAIVAIVGWWDDRRGVSPGVRMVAHLTAAAIGLWLVGGFAGINLGGVRMEMGIAGEVLALAGIVWAINLFNFMDGIDGIAGVEAVTVGVGGALLLWIHATPGGVLAPLILAAAAAGFLVWNWAPARIFMGDVGSGYLGYCFAILAIWSEGHGGPSVLSWAALAMAFILDATVTLGRRFRRHQRLTEAHRSHAYQRLVQSGWSHRAVTGSVLAINLLLTCTILLSPVVGLLISVLICGVAFWWVERLRPM